MTTTATQGDAPAAPRPDVLEGAVLSGLEQLDQPEQTDDRWVITDEGQADWAARKLERVRADQAKVDRQAQRQIEAIDAAVAPYKEPIIAFRDDELSRLATEESHWEFLLAQYHRSLLAEDPERLSEKLPHAVLKSRKLPDKWEFDDGFLEWAKTNAPELVRVKEEIDKATAKKFLKVDDDNLVTMAGVDGYVPAVTVFQGERKFEVVTDGAS